MVGSLQCTNRRELAVEIVHQESAKLSSVFGLSLRVRTKFCLVAILVHV